MPHISTSQCIMHLEERSWYPTQPSSSKHLMCQDLTLLRIIIFSSLNPSTLNPQPINPSTNQHPTLKPSTLNPSTLNPQSINSSTHQPINPQPSTLNSLHPYLHRFLGAMSQNGIFLENALFLRTIRFCEHKGAFS